MTPEHLPSLTQVKHLADFRLRLAFSRELRALVQAGGPFRRLVGVTLDWPRAATGANRCSSAEG